MIGQVTTRQTSKISATGQILEPSETTSKYKYKEKVEDEYDFRKYMDIASKMSNFKEVTEEERMYHKKYELNI